MVTPRGAKEGVYILLTPQGHQRREAHMVTRRGAKEGVHILIPPRGSKEGRHILTPPRGTKEKDSSVVSWKKGTYGYPRGAKEWGIYGYHQGYQ